MQPFDKPRLIQQAFLGACLAARLAEPASAPTATPAPSRGDALPDFMRSEMP
ncbi:MAG: hypothetical protein QM617_06425 [Comamonas sp.]